MKKFAVLLLVIVLIIGSMPELPHAELYDMEGDTYWDFIWKYQDGILTFSGEGEITSYTGGIAVNYKYYYPWHKIGGKVKKIVLDEGITKISTDILKETISFEEIVIPASLVEIDGILFSNSLKNIVVDENNPAYTSVDGVLFDKEQTKLIKYPGNRDSSTYIVPDSVKVIGKRAFYFDKLTEVVFGNNLIEIQDEAFYYTNLTRVILPESLVTIGKQAFYRCRELEEVVFGEGVTDIGTNAFYRCDKLTKVNLPKSLVKIGSGAFGYANIKSVTIPGSIKTIAGGAFAFCANLKEVIIEEGVETVYKSAFEDCVALELVVVPDSVSKIEYGAFSGCNLLWENDNLYIGKWLIESNASGEYYIKDGTEKIADQAFKNCNNLTVVKVPESVKAMDCNVFDSSLSLEGICVDDENTAFASINGILYDKNAETLIFYPSGKKDKTLIVPEGVKTISNNAFSFYMNHKEDWIKCVELPDSVENIGTAFRYLGMEEIILGEGIKIIDSYAFYRCENLEKITLGKNLCVIGEAAFQKCLSLEKIVLSDGIETIDKGAFLECGKLKEIHLPSSLKTIGDGAFMYCAQLEEIHIPESVTNIGSNLVTFCDNLSAVYYSGSEEMWQQISKGVGNASLDRLIVYNYSGIGVKVNENDVDFTAYRQSPYIKNDRTMVPMRAIFEALGATVTWDAATKTAIGVKGGIEVKITIGENVLYKNGEAVELDCAAEITNDRTMVPVRAISEAFGCTVNWNDETKTVEITN